MDEERLEVLREAQRVRQRKEEMERAIGRAVRNKNHDFRYYVALVSELRELASSKGVSMDQVVETLLEEERGDDECSHENDSDN